MNKAIWIVPQCTNPVDDTRSILLEDDYNANQIIPIHRDIEAHGVYNGEANKLVFHTFREHKGLSNDTLQPWMLLQSFMAAPSLEIFVYKMKVEKEALQALSIPGRIFTLVGEDWGRNPIPKMNPILNMMWGEFFKEGSWFYTALINPNYTATAGYCNWTRMRM
jgi:hypothetical protein